MRQKEDGVKTPEHCQIFLMQADIALERIAKKSRRADWIENGTLVALPSAVLPAILSPRVQFLYGRYSSDIFFLPHIRLSPLSQRAARSGQLFPVAA
jgi:hypothetical protein